MRKDMATGQKRSLVLLKRALVPRSFVHPWGLCDVRVAFEGIPSAAKKSFTGVTFC